MNIKNLVPRSWFRDDDLMKFDMESPFFSLQREMNHLIENFSRSFFEMVPEKSDWIGFGTGMPRMDVTETVDEVQVTAELPGLDEKDIDVSLANNILTIKGEKKQEKEEKKKEFYRMERSYGKFQRSIPIPCEIQEDKVEATFKKGVLTLRLPKTAEARLEVKKIPVKAE